MEIRNVTDAIIRYKEKQPKLNLVLMFICTI